MKKPKLFDADSVERLRQIILATESFQAHLRPEPHWAAVVAPLKLPQGEATALVISLKRLWLLPFADPAALGELLVFQHTRLAEHERNAGAAGEDRRLRLCVLFRYLVQMALQGNSVFPQDPTHLARQVQLALEPGLGVADELDSQIIITVLPEAHIARQLGVLNDYAMPVDVCLPQFRRRRDADGSTRISGSLA